MEILNISELDDFKERLLEGIDKTIIKGAYMIANKAKEILKQDLPAAAVQGDFYDDTLADAIYAGKYNDGTKTIKVTSLGNRSRDSGTFRTRFFVNGTKERTQTGGYRKTKEGIKYVQYAKPYKNGSITGTNAVGRALSEMEEQIHDLFKNIQEV